MAIKALLLMCEKKEYNLLVKVSLSRLW